MKIQYVSCLAQHLHCLTDVMAELEKRGHKVIYKQTEYATPSAPIMLEDSDMVISSFSRDVKVFQGNFGVKVCIEHGINPIISSFPMNNINRKNFDHILCSGKWQVEHAGNLESKCILAGFPKSDELLRMRKRKDELVKEVEGMMKGNFIEGEPIVVFVPTHSGAWTRTKEITDLKIPNLIVAPHELRYREYQRDAYGAWYDWYIETPNVNKLIAVADVILTDFSSAGFEALAIPDLPVIQILAPTVNEKNQDAQKRGAYVTLLEGVEVKVGRNMDDLSDLHAEILYANEHKIEYFKKERGYWRDQLLYDCGNAVANCCDFIDLFSKSSK